MPRLILASLLLATALASSAAAQTSADLADSLLKQSAREGSLPWSARHAVSWPDFRGRLQLGGSTAAQTSSGVSYVIQCRNERLSFAVLAAFSPGESWVRPDIAASPTASAATLRHERTHFAITELFARRLRQAFATSLGVCPHHTKEARRVFDRLKSKADEQQRRYDKETSHGLSASAQVRWDRSVVAGLDSLKAYAIDEGKE